MAPKTVPEQWAALLVEAKLVDPRNGAPSMRKLAEAADTHPTTISAMMYGERETKPEVVDAVVEAIAMRIRADDQRRSNLRREIHLMVGRALQESEPFALHPDADLLTPAERKAVNEMIRLLALSKKEDTRSETLPKGVSELPKRGTKIGTGREAARRKRPKSQP